MILINYLKFQYIKQVRNTKKLVQVLFKYFNNPQDLLSRLELLGGSIKAGNNNNEIKNEFSEIAHVLKKLNIFTNDQLKNLLKNYVL